MRRSPKFHILKLESFVGKDTYLHCVIATRPDGTAEVTDSGYRTEAEVRKAWGDVLPRRRSR